MSDVEIDPRFQPLAHFMETGIPFNQHLGIRVEALREGECVLRLPFDASFIGDPLRPAIHGGVLSSLADTAGGAACFSLLMNADDRVSTVDLRVDFLQPGPSEELRCLARVVRMGNRVGVAHMQVLAGDGPEPVATAQGVYNIVRRSDGA
jgi:uncharacterized protein (TIGR00369 family)